MIPKTFSAPGDATFPALNGFVPTPEDSLRYAVWLIAYSDDVLRRSYSYVPGDDAKGVRIFQNQPDYDPETLAMTLPALLVDIVVSDSRFTYSTSNAGEMQIVIGAAHIEAATSATIRPDVEAPSLLATTRLGRLRQALMRGTLYKDGMVTNKGRVLDPYLTPKNEDGTFDMNGAVWLTTMPPDIVPARRVKFPNRRWKTDAEFAALDPVRDFAVSFGLLAKYTVIVRDRDAMR